MKRVFTTCCLTAAILMAGAVQASVYEGVVNRSALMGLKPLTAKPLVISEKLTSAAGKQALRSINLANLLPPMKALGLSLEKVQAISQNLQKQGVKPLTD